MRWTCSDSSSSPDADMKPKPDVLRFSRSIATFEDSARDYDCDVAFLTKIMNRKKGVSIHIRLLSTACFISESIVLVKGDNVFLHMVILVFGLHAIMVKTAEEIPVFFAMYFFGRRIVQFELLHWVSNRVDLLASKYSRFVRFASPAVMRAAMRRCSAGKVSGTLKA